MSLLDNLNPEQLQAVTTRSKSLLVLAGAGTGKTKVLTNRIAYLIQERGVSPHNILALTFTRKAAQEMKDRIKALTDEKTAKQIWIGTFHAISLRILEQFGSRLGYSPYISIYDEIDQQDIIASIIEEFNLKVKPKNVIAQLQGYGSDCDNFEFKVEAGTVVSIYRERLKSYNAVDYTLLLTETLELLRKFPDVFSYYNNRFKYLFVDEYQDTDHTQYYLHEVLKPGNICVVGDFQQSIYHFRGSDINIILDFEKNYPNSEVVKLEQCYRCPSNVVTMANNLISHNERHDVFLWTNNRTEPCETVFTVNELFEAMNAQNWIQALICSGRSYRDIVILSRTHSYLQAIEDLFSIEKIPFKHIGKEQEFWKSQPARLIISLLKVLHNPKDTYHFMRIASTLLYSLKQSEVLYYEARALKGGCRVYDILLSEKGGKFKELVDIYDDSEPLFKVIDKIIDKLGLKNYYEERGLFHKRDELQQIQIQADLWTEQNPDDPTVKSFLSYLSSQEVQTEIDNSDTVKLATIHAVKGLEFPFVFIVGANEGRMPHQRAQLKEELEEERRLFYVAITRTKEALFIYAPKEQVSRPMEGRLEPSRFIEDCETMQPEGVKK